MTDTIIRIVESTPENLVETMDWATRNLEKCKWYDIPSRMFWERAIVQLAVKRVKLLEEK